MAIKRTYLITGGAARIGRELALAAVPDASAIVIHYHKSKAAAEELAQEIINMNVKAVTVSADFASPDETTRMMQEAWNEAGPIDVLINNASIFEPSTVNEMTYAELERNMMINAFAPLVLCRQFAKLNESRTPEALPVIVNLLDARIVEYDRTHAAYHLAKRMLFALTKMLALEFAPAVRVNAVAPGLILPPRGKDRSYLEQLKSRNLLKAIGSVEQVAEAVKFLVNNEFVTGQVVYVDGGRNLIGTTYE